MDYRLFHPIRFLYKRLRHPVIIFEGALALVAIYSVVAWLHLDGIHGQIGLLEGELAGLDHASQIRAIVEPLQEYRGRRYALTSDGQEESDLLVLISDGIDAAFSGLRLYIGEVDDPLELRASVAELQAHWELIRGSDAEGDPSHLFAEFTSVVDALIGLHGLAIRRSGLELENDPETYHLVQGLDLLLELVLEPSGQVRALNAGALASADDAHDMQHNIRGRADVLDLALERIVSHFSAAKRAHPELDQKLCPLTGSLGESVDLIRSLVYETENDVAGDKAEVFFQSATDAIHEGYLLYDNASEAARDRVTRLLQEERSSFRSSTILLVMLGAGIIYLIGGTIADGSVRRANEERIRFMAEHDALTGLPNRTIFMDRLRQAIANAERRGERVALLFIDLDRFKEINDSFGHQTGDELLKGIALRLESVLRASDSVCRHGGDEFLVLITDAGGEESIAQVARKIVDELSLPFVIAEQKIRTSPSIGISIFPLDAHDSESLIIKADFAMYRVKQEGRGSWRFCTPE